MKDIKVLKSIQEVREWRAELGKVAFVPTMGALHQGHLDLVKKASELCDNVVVSIFVNPAQFAPNEDYDQYPRKTEQDIELLKELNVVSAVYLPQKEEIYPRGIVLNVEEQVGTFAEVKGLSHQLEGAIRPHFFRGVATIVLKLFNIVEPTFALFGQKDAQQCVVLKNMVKDLCLKVKIVVCPITRSDSGLALSSRNQYLSEEQKDIGLTLYKALVLGEKLFNEKTDPKQLVQKVIEYIQSESRVELDYIKLNDSNTLEEIISPDQLKNGGLLSGAIRIGGVRLIDNICIGCQL